VRIHVRAGGEGGVNGSDGDRDHEGGLSADRGGSKAPPVDS
jgi:hypothetical protein